MSLIIEHINAGVPMPGNEVGKTKKILSMVALLLSMLLLVCPAWPFTA